MLIAAGCAVRDRRPVERVGQAGFSPLKGTLAAGITAWSLVAAR
jgi:hypothetical protein